MDFKPGDIVRVRYNSDFNANFPEELGIVIQTNPGYAWANFVMFPLLGAEMLVSTRWLTKVGEVDR